MATDTKKISKSLKDNLRDTWKFLRPEEFNIAEKLAAESGLPGSAEGPRDALRHMLGAYLLYKKYPGGLIDVGEVLYEGLTFDEDRGARQRDFHNNKIGKTLLRHNSLGDAYLAALRIISRGRYQGSYGVKDTETGVGETSEMRAAWKSDSRWEGATLDRKIEAAIEKHNDSAISVDHSEKGASSKPSNNEGKEARERAAKQAREAERKAARERRRKEEKEKKDKDKDKNTEDGPTINLTKSVPDEPIEFFPETAEELRQMLIDLGMSVDEIEDVLQDANLTDWDIHSILRELHDYTLADALIIGALISGVDTTDEFISAMDRLMRGVSGYSFDVARLQPEITDPPKPDERNLDLIIVRGGG